VKQESNANAVLVDNAATKPKASLRLPALNFLIESSFLQRTRRHRRRSMPNRQEHFSQARQRNSYRK